MGAGVFLVGGLAKLGLDLSNSRSKRIVASEEPQEVEPLHIDGMNMPPEDGWTYHPPPAK
jgi:hypothetical protein